MAKPTTGRHGNGGSGPSLWRCLPWLAIILVGGWLVYLVQHASSLHLQVVNRGDSEVSRPSVVLKGGDGSSTANKKGTDAMMTQESDKATPEQIFFQTWFGFSSRKSDQSAPVEAIPVPLSVVKQKTLARKASRIKPILGDIPINGVQPMYGKKHKGGDAIFALAANYPKLYYERFVGSLRKFGFDDDIVLSVSVPAKMKPGVGDYLQRTDCVAYGFDVDCEGKDNCRLRDDFLGYPDPRPYRTFANIRYALYEYWLQYYSDQSYILILDFRDTFFQANPFQSFGPLLERKPKYELQLFEENYTVKNIGKCVFNSLWVGKCFGKPALEALRSKPVLCSGSTLGSYQAINHYVRTMLHSMDTVKCWLKGIESDQGYQNYLFYNGHFNLNGVNATAFKQGEGIVNTIGALNGHRVPKDMKGPLDTHWHARDKNGWIINYDGTRSACVHQWDRWYQELSKWVDMTVYDKEK